MKDRRQIYARFCAINDIRQIASGGHSILTMSTTGIKDPQIIEICLIDAAGEEVFYSLVKPSKAIEPTASRIHQFYDADLEAAPIWSDVIEKLDTLIPKDGVVCWNSEFFRITLGNMKQQFPESRQPDWKLSELRMIAAQFSGEWSDKHKRYKLVSLSSWLVELKQHKEATLGGRAQPKAKMLKTALELTAAEQLTIVGEHIKFLRRNKFIKGTIHSLLANGQCVVDVAGALLTVEPIKHASVQSLGWAWGYTGRYKE